LALIRQAQSKDAEHALTTSKLNHEQHLVELREQFVAVLGHDLRNPLAAIIAGLNMIERDPTGERAAAMLPMMKLSAARMTELIENTLDFARTRLGGGIVLHRTLNDALRGRLDHVVAEVRVSHPECRIETAFELTEPVLCDPDRIDQMTSNLLLNAVTHGDATQPISVAASTQGGQFTLSVANAGEPIPLALLEQLFQPFSPGATTARKGLGLGLYICAEIARAHDGSLSLASTPGQTRFVFQMPLKA